MARVGVLAVQGAFERHANVVRSLQHEPVLVQAPAHMENLDGLILPGGESTTQLMLLERLGIEAPLQAFVSSGKPVLATCAGLILAARTVHNPEQRSYGWIDLTVTRNAYGRQLDSFEAESDSAPKLPLIFIRAPRITAHGPNVEVLARHKGEPVLVRERNLTCATFHPELSDDTTVHARVFASLTR
jgi:pyridoxal 5'-phosphate synthase pdxT subunit